MNDFIVLEVFKYLEMAHGFTVTYVPVNQGGLVDLEVLTSPLIPSLLFLSHSTISHPQLSLPKFLFHLLHNPFMPLTQMTLISFVTGP